LEQTQVIKSSQVDSCETATESLLALSKSLEEIKPSRGTGITEEAAPSPSMKEILFSLKRTNRVLYVLYEISRQMNTLRNFNALLEKIMDLVFQVIDADYGFVVLTDKQEDKDLTPAVVKFKDPRLQKNEQLKPSRTIINRIIQDRVALLTSDVTTDPRLGPTESLVSQKI